MKQIIIFLLMVIIGIMGFNYYNKYQRFNPPNYEYQPSEDISAAHENKEMLYDYFQAIEHLNGYVITQWGANKIDVRNPKKDNARTHAAVAKYAEKLGKVKYYESQLLAPHVDKKLESDSDRKIRLVKSIFYADPKINSLRIGDKSAFIYEIQKLLNLQGENIKVDGVFNIETKTALESFEKRAGLYVDGKLDAITLEHLILMQ